MKTFHRMLIVAAAVSFAACAQRPAHWVRLYDVDKVHSIDKSLTKEQITRAVLEGAEDAGWRAKDLGDGRVLATYSVRVHTVNVEITIGDDTYDTRYRSSTGMKVYCSWEDKQKHRSIKVTGRDDCPNQADPAFIHYGYKRWVDSLNNSIRLSLASVQ